MEFDIELLGERGNIKSIVTMVCNTYKVNALDIYSKSQKREHSEPRQVVMYCLKKFTTLNPTAIARELNRDRSTVISSIDAVNDFISVDPQYREKVLSIIEKIIQWQKKKQKQKKFKTT
jgi:chromosomal replication initiator protein